METPFLRTQMLLGEEKLNKLKNSRVAVFGVGGVGGFTVEALSRSGVGSIDLFDGDDISISNINRQIIADVLSVGKPKVDVFKGRILAINPNAKVDIFNKFLTAEDVMSMDFSVYDYVIDAIDTVSTKIAIICKANAQNVPVISCMGTGGKVDITRLKVGKISKTEGCPLARVMRRELKKRGIDSTKVVYSNEVVANSQTDSQEHKLDGKKAPPSMIFVPAAAGLMLAQEVVKDLTSD